MLESQNILDVHTADTVNTAGMGRPKKHEGRKAVTVYLSEAEYKYVVLQAGAIPLSTWCLHRLLPTGSVPEGAGELRIEPQEQLRPPAIKMVSASRKSKTCVHGIVKGHHCWQCQGLAKVE